MKASDESNVLDGESKTPSIHSVYRSIRIEYEPKIVVIDVVVSSAVSLTSRSRQRSPLIRKNFCVRQVRINANRLRTWRGIALRILVTRAWLNAVLAEPRPPRLPCTNS